METIKAIACLNKAIINDANNASAWINLGYAYYNIRNLPQAQQSFHKSFEFKPNNADDERANERARKWCKRIKNEL